MPAGDPRNPVAFRFEDLTDDDFDRLTYLVAHLKDPQVIKLRAPDGGLDTVRTREDKPDEASWGLQAKLYPAQISWSKCKASLDRAVTQWGRPDRVTFAFPRDLTENQHKLFVKHLVNRHPDVKVDWWGQTKLTAALNGSPEGGAIAKEFFHREDPVDVADRLARAGGPLRTVDDLLTRQGAIGEFLQTAGPHFRFQTTQGRRGEQVPPVAGSAMRLEFERGNDQITVDAVPKTNTALEHFGPKGRVTFKDADRARDLLNAVQEVGGRAVLGEATVRMERIPPPFDALLANIDGVVSIRAEARVEPWAARLMVATDTGRESLDVDLVPERPAGDWDSVLAGRRHGLEVELRFRWEHDTASGAIEINWTYTQATGTAAERARVLGFVVALHGTGTFSIEDREERRPPLSERTEKRPLPIDLQRLRDTYRDLAEVQEFAGTTFGPPPDHFTGDDTHNLAFLADQLRRGATSAKITSATFVVNGEGLQAFREVRSKLAVRDQLYARLFGREVHIAQRLTVLPPMCVAQAVRRADGDWDVELVPVAGRDAPVHIEYSRPGANVRTNAAAA